jgi:predicted nucleic acid-binding protein
MLDASFYIAWLDRRDQWHARAAKLESSLPRELVTTDLLAAEVIATLASRGGGNAARTAWQVIGDTAEIEFMDRRSCEAGMDLVISFDGRLSLADATAVVVMRERGMKRILSFDDGFDRLKDIERLS